MKPEIKKLLILNKPQRRDAFSLPLFRSAADAAAKPF